MVKIMVFILSEVEDFGGVRRIGVLGFDLYFKGLFCLRIGQGEQKIEWVVESSFEWEGIFQ